MDQRSKNCSIQLKTCLVPSKPTRETGGTCGMRSRTPAKHSKSLDFHRPQNDKRRGIGSNRLSIKSKNVRSRRRMRQRNDFATLNATLTKSDHLLTKRLRHLNRAR